MNEKLFENFVKKAKIKFGDKFDYSKVDYEKGTEPIIIICPEHGEISITPNKFISSKFGCPECSKKARRKSSELFIEESKKLYGDRFNYDKTYYISSDEKVIVTCPIHGDFLTRPADFLRGHNCPGCKGEKTKNFNITTKRLSTELFIEQCKLIYENLFSYEKTHYINERTKVIVHSNICDEDFMIFPYNFIRGNIRKKYLGKDLVNKLLTLEDFILRAKLIHGDYYNYDKTEYAGYKTKICVTCPKHGDFWLSPGDHLNNKQGCPICNQSKGEEIISLCLDRLKLLYIRQFKVTLQTRNIFVDFAYKYLDLLIFIEYNGQLHYKPVKIFGGEETFKKLQERDLMLLEYCKNNNIKLLIYSYELNWEDLVELVESDIKQIMGDVKDKSRH